MNGCVSREEKSQVKQKPKAITTAPKKVPVNERGNSVGNIPVIRNNKINISPQKAWQIIRNFVQDKPVENYHFEDEGTREINGRIYYVFHEYEMLIPPDSDVGMTSTLGWYYVDTKNGKAYEDNDGVLIQLHKDK